MPKCDKCEKEKIELKKEIKELTEELNSYKRDVKRRWDEAEDNPFNNWC